jgi:hypothetical protein
MSRLEQTDRSADRIRGELIATLQELDRRRHRALNVRYQAASHLGGLAIAASALLLGVGILAVVLRRRREVPKRRLADFTHGFRRAWRHPDRIASRAKDRPLPSELFRRVTLAFTSALAGRVARETANRLVTSSRPA